MLIDVYAYPGNDQRLAGFLLGEPVECRGHDRLVFETEIGL